jgi:hypothetical protein
MDLSPVPFPNGKGCLLNEERRILAYLDSVQAWLASHKGMISLRELQSQTQEELDALSSSPSAASGIPSVLRPQATGGRAFKGEL